MTNYYSALAVSVMSAVMPCLLSLATGCQAQTAQAVQVDIAQVQWTDARRFWTMEGQRLPVLNQNLMGHPISIGGKKYMTGIAGHTGFSVVYQVAGKALEFSAIAGIDDESHPRDKDTKESSVNIIVMVDRGEVFRHKVFWKQKGVPFKIDLRGKHQIELRGEYGTGFRKQRVVFANARFLVKDRKAFLGETTRQRQAVCMARNVAPDYPPAPRWTGAIKVRRIHYRQWEHAYELSNRACRLILVPELGGRIKLFALRDRKNIMYENPRLNSRLLRVRGGTAWCGGHFSRLQPRNYFLPSDPILVSVPYTITFPRNGEAIMTSGPSIYLGTQIEYRVRLDPVTAKVRITTTHRNISDYAHKAGIWSITRLKPTGILMMPMERKSPPRPGILEPREMLGLVKPDPTGKWQTLDLSIPRIRDNLPKPRWTIQWTLFPQQNAIRIKTANQVFTKSFAYDSVNDAQMEGFFPAHFYLCKRLMEVECHGPTVTLAPGSQIALDETWTLEPFEK